MVLLSRFLLLMDAVAMLWLDSNSSSDVIAIAYDCGAGAAVDDLLGDIVLQLFAALLTAGFKQCQADLLLRKVLHFSET